MQRLRLLLATRPGAMAWLVACVLAMRMLVPGGYMPVAADDGIVLRLCAGATPTPAAPHAAMAGMHHDGGDPQREMPTESAMPCAFAGLGFAAIDLPAPALATVAVAYALPAATRMVLPRPNAAQLRWRPPLRAPPTA